MNMRLSTDINLGLALRNKQCNHTVVAGKAAMARKLLNVRLLVTFLTETG